jgi:hypothetical protein
MCLLPEVLRADAADVFATRIKVAALAAALNARSRLLLQAFMPLAEDAARAAPAA